VVGEHGRLSVRCRRRVWAGDAGAQLPEPGTDPSASSAAAFVVNVSPSTWSGRTKPFATSQTTRADIVSVLPEPAPATTTAGASGAPITAACSAVGGGRPSAAASVGVTSPTSTVLPIAPATSFEPPTERALASVRFGANRWPL